MVGGPIDGIGLSLMDGALLFTRRRLLWPIQCQLAGVTTSQFADK